jgi:MFS family permease
MSQAIPATLPVAHPTRRRDFQKYWAGQTISNLGSAVTGFALPLIVYKLTGSALNLGISTATSFLPYLLFGLVLGAWVDRVNRKRLMIATDLGRGALIASIPVLALSGWLPVWWLYAVGFLHTTLTIAFEAAQFAAIPALVGRDDLVAANGRIQASYSAAGVAGPLLAGLLVGTMAVDQLLWFDALSFAVSALLLALIATRFNATAGMPGQKLHLGRDVAEGLRYVWRHPVLRNIAVMMALVNFVSIMTGAQLVAFAKEQLAATDGQVVWLYAAESAGMVVGALLVARLHKHFSFSALILGALVFTGLATVDLALTIYYWPALVLCGIVSGSAIIFNINTGSLRQAIVPDNLLGRVQTSGRVLAWSTIPLGSLVGGWAISATGNIGLVFGLVGLSQIVIPLAFALTALGHADRYLPSSETVEEVEEPQAA